MCLGAMGSETVYLRTGQWSYLDELVESTDGITNRSQAIQYVINEYQQLQEAKNNE